MAIVNSRLNLGAYGPSLRGLGAAPSWLTPIQTKLANAAKSAAEVAAANRPTYRAKPTYSDDSQQTKDAVAAANAVALTPVGETPEQKEARRVAALNNALAQHYADNPTEVPDAREIAKQTAALTYDPSRWTKAVAAVTAPSSPWVQPPASTSAGGGVSWGGGGGSDSKPALALPGTGIAGWSNQKKLMVAGGALAAAVVIYLALKKKV